MTENTRAGGATSEAKRVRILEAAFEVAQRRGVAGARMEEVAELAEVSKGTLYRFFNSKEDLFLATILASYAEGQRLVATPGARRSARESLAALVEGLVAVLAAVGPRARVYYQAWGVVANAVEFQERLYCFLSDFHNDREREMEALIREGQRDGSFRTDVSAPALAATMSALLSGFIYRASFDQGAASPSALRACLDTLTAGLGTTARASEDPSRG